MSLCHSIVWIYFYSTFTTMNNSINNGNRKRICPIFKHLYRIRMNLYACADCLLTNGFHGKHGLTMRKQLWHTHTHNHIDKYTRIVLCQLRRQQTRAMLKEMAKNQKIMYETRLFHFLRKKATRNEKKTETKKKEKKSSEKITIPNRRRIEDYL